MNNITHIVTCNGKDFYFNKSSEAYALQAYFNAVNQEASVEAVTINTVAVTALPPLKG